MLSGFYTVASGMLSQQRDLDVIGNNLVNQQTPGYRADRTLISPFEMELATRREASGDAALGRGAPAAVVSEVATLMQNGDLRETGRSFDLAINGDGFFNIRAENGQIMLTRGGNFDTDENGDLVLPGVGRVLGRNGDTLRVGGPGFRVDETGQVYNQDDRRVGSLMLTAPEEGSALTKLDGGLFMVRYNRETGGFETTEIEGDTGPANVCVVLGKDKDLILAANHRIGEGAVYTVTD